MDADVHMEMSVSNCLLEQFRCESEHRPTDSFHGNIRSIQSSNTLEESFSMMVAR